MDLRKSIMAKRSTLYDSFADLSIASWYESANDDSVSSVFFSPTNDTTLRSPAHVFNDSMDGFDVKNSQLLRNGVKACAEEKLKESDKELINKQYNSAVQHNKETNVNKTEVSNILFGKKPKAQDSDVKIHVLDPNGNIINPSEKIPSKTDQIGMTPKKDQQRFVLKSKVPIKPLFYSPIMRKSSTALPQTTGKLSPSRSTVSASSPLRRTVSKPTAKIRTYKCSISGCSLKFATMTACKEHQNMHKTNMNQAQNKFDCKWCDKKFQMEIALLNHLADKCLKISFNEKRKVLKHRDEFEKERRRAALSSTMAAPGKTLTRAQSSTSVSSSSFKSCT